MHDAEGQKIKRRLLEFTFKVLTICGCWRPNTWVSLHKRIIYHLYTVTMILLMNTFMLSQLMDIIMNVRNADDFSDNFYILLAIFISSYKMFSLLANNRSIAKLTDILIQQPFRPMSIGEIEIQYNFDKGIEIYILCYATLGLTTSAGVVLTSLLTNFGEKKLTYRAWLPFEYSSTTLFCLLYVHQLIGFTFGALLNVACDGLICGLLVHICCQLEILAYRLKKIMLYSGTLRDCIRLHCHFRFAFIVNATFRMVITIQFLISMLVVCFNLYQLTKLKIGARFIEIAMFMCCMLTQIFVYCWYGNEVKLKSRQLIDNIFNMDWLMLNENVKKSLLIIMKRTVLPIEFTSFYTISMNLDSFVGILKTSYSIYNLLLQMG